MKQLQLNDLKKIDISVQCPWLWGVLGSVLMYILLSIFAGKVSMDSLITISYSATFLTIAAFGQMLVITTGSGAIDLSIASVITLSAFLTTGLNNVNNMNMFWALPVVILVGAVIGFFNAFFTIELKIPSIISTLGMSYIVQTIILLYNNIFKTFAVAPALLKFTRARIFGVLPVMIILIVLLILVFTFIFKKTRYGKSLIAVGQNEEAAALAGINVKLIKYFAFTASSVFASIAGIFVSARAGGAFYGMGDSYQLLTLASCVVGGTSIAGGKAVPVGVFFGALFLNLLETAMKLAGLRIGMQNVLTGLFIIAVLFLSAKDSRQ